MYKKQKLNKNLLLLIYFKTMTKRMLDIELHLKWIECFVASMYTSFTYGSICFRMPKTNVICNFIAGFVCDVYCYIMFPTKFGYDIWNTWCSVLSLHNTFWEWIECVCLFNNEQVLYWGEIVCNSINNDCERYESIIFTEICM